MGGTSKARSTRQWVEWWAENRSLAVCLLIGHLVLISLLALWHSGTLQTLEVPAYDHGLRRQILPPPDDRIVVIGETETDLHRWGYPLTDDLLAQVLERLAAGRPRVIGVDKYRDLPVPPGSELLDQLLRRHPEIVWVTRFGHSAADDPEIAPPAALAQTDQTGFGDVPLDPDGRVRRGLLFLDHGGQTATAFALAVSLRYLQAEHIVPSPDPDDPARLRLGRTTIPPLPADAGSYVNADAAGYQYLLDYRGRIGTAQLHSVSDVLERRLSPAQLADKIVLLGGMATSLRDDFQIPVDHILADPPPGTAPGRIAGVLLHALQINQLLRFALVGDRPIRGLANWAETGWCWCWCMVGVGLAQWRRRFRWSLLAMTVALAALAGIWRLALFEQIWLPLVTPALGLTITAALCRVYLSVQDHAEKRILMNLFASHVAPEVAATLWRERKQLMNGGRLMPQRLTVTVLFADLRGFTTIAEGLEPAALMDWLNGYMAAMTEVVMAHGGIVKQYVGDQIMALFGAPTPRWTAGEIAEDARRAVQCALAMGERLQQLNIAWTAQGLPTVAVRIGIHTGPLVAGSLGGQRRLEYAVVGDTVNIASRLESYHKDSPEAARLPCRILISAATAEGLDQRFRVIQMGRIQFKGRQQDLMVYRVEDLASPAGRESGISSLTSTT